MGEGGSFDLSAELAALAAETGMRVDLDPGSIRQSVVKPRFSFDRNAEITVGKSDEGDRLVHELLDALIAREFQTSEAWASVIFQLEAVRSAPRVHLKTTEAATHVALANVGAGRLLRVSIKRFPNEEAAAVRCLPEEYRDGLVVLDGGDLRVELRPDFHPWLEGSVLRSVGRRRKEAADSSSDDD